MKLNKKLLLSSLVVALANSSQSFAAGYATNMTSTSGIGNAYAGSVTGIHDISDTFFNPAVTAGMKKTQFIASLSYLDLNIKSRGASGNFSGGGAAGGDDSSAGTKAVVPAFYISTPINDKINFNFAVTSPFGLATKYNDTWAGRYRARESEITTYNFNPSIAYKVNDAFSIGAGVVAQYYKAVFTKMAYTGGADAAGKVKGDSWGYGFNLGATWNITDDLKAGIGYRSKIDHNLSGASSAPAVGYYSDALAYTQTPESLTAGLAYKVNSLVDVAYDMTWTRWSRLKHLQVNTPQNSNLASTTNFNWHDSFLNSVGANFNVRKGTIIRTGLAYEKDAISDANRETRVPTGDRIWTTLGLSQKLNHALTLDLSYCHQFYRVAHINQTDSSVTVNSLQAKYKTSVDVFSVAVKADF